MLNFFIVAIAICVFLYLAFSSRLARSERWKATVTPLASIMGSGFLVVAPLLADSVGYFAVFCMAILLLLAYAVGGAIRFNIRHFEPIEHQRGPAQTVSFVSRIVLAAAYFISVTYYLQLLSAFLLNAFGYSSELWSNIITSLILLFIGGVGMWRGLSQLEKIESYAVSLNLGMIAGLLFALALYNIRLVSTGSWHLPTLDSTIDLHDLRVLLGLLIVVQGFETSRYLQSEHPAELRISTMRLAQWISAGIYIVFLSLMTVLFQHGMGADVTAITSMVAPVAILLPILISVAAIGSQFSASVADTSGAGGLVEDIAQEKIPVRYAYLLVLIVTLFLTWATDVNAIIAYASRAFALFYTLQSATAAIVAYQTKTLEKRTQKVRLFSLISLLCLLVFLFGLPSE
ncbi:hypothetical protein [Marinomonas pollencensis]|uniref:Na+/proline symporter n=1 Tax=Marinomonas pollencensis TaxID=491954 RepID=A0A3E0DQ08_9GAMM|nr:hypothetical protein [Marinomonas pollencensis]REG85010.1 hypothetical protein DFP81_103209 [Marinomonas pollencensis]